MSVNDASPYPRDFRGYGGNPPDPKWPGSARVAVSLVVNVEAGSELSLADGDERNESVYENVEPVEGVPNHCLASHFEYGTRAGYWRIMRTLEHFDAPCTVSAAGRAIERSPWLAEDVVARGHEISCHSYRWERHLAAEFELKDADAAIAVMTERHVLTHVPVATDATGREALRKFYAETFIPQMPPDADLQLLRRTVGQNRIIDEFILRFTHTLRMDWFAPGIEPTGRRLEVPHVGVIEFEGDKIASEHIYWDHASVPIQLGVLDAERLPALGSEQIQRLLNPDADANRPMDRS